MPGFDFLLDADQRVDLFLMRLIICQGRFHGVDGEIIFLGKFTCCLPPTLVSHNECFNPQASAADDRGGYAGCAPAIGDRWKARVVKVKGIQPRCYAFIRNIRYNFGNAPLTRQH